MILDLLRRLWRTREVRNGLLFVALMLLIFRVVAHIPLPGVDAAILTNQLQGNTFFGLFNVFSGGTLSNFSIAAMGVAPYITASIVFQLLGMIFPSVEEMQKEEQGRKKLTQWSRVATVPLGLIQAYGLIALLRQQAPTAFAESSFLSVLVMMVIMTTGSVFLMWLGELMSEKKVGNGMSILIFAGIIAGLPAFLGQSIALYDKSQIVTMVLFLLVALITIIAVVIMNEAQRRIPVQYSKQARGSRVFGAVTSHIPLKLMMSGVVPVIFAISVLLFPTTIAQFFVNARSSMVREAANLILALIQNQVVYGIAYFSLVLFFAYFYTSIVFQPQRVAENLHKQGGFIPGIRPGEPTSSYLSFVVNRLLFAGGLFLALIAVLPLIMQQATGGSLFVIGGTSILIVVSSVIESVKQVEAQLTLHEYDQI